MIVDAGQAGERPADEVWLSAGVALVAADPPTAEEQRKLAAGDDAEVRGPAKPSRLRLLDALGIRVLYGNRHVTEIAQQPGGGPLAVLTWSSPELDPGLLTPELHVVSLSGEARDLGPAVVEAHSPVWRRAGAWRIAYLALTPPSLRSGLAVYDTVDGNLTRGLPACPVELVQMADGDPLMIVAEGLDTAVHRLSSGLVSRHTGSFSQVSAAGDALAAVASTRL